MAKLESIVFIFIFILFSFTVLFFVYYYYHQNQSCLSNPLTYSANYYLERTTAKKVIGTLTLFGDIGTQPLEITFTHNSSKIKNKGGDPWPLPNLTKIINFSGD